MDDYQTVDSGEYERLMAILNRNSDKSFVQRILRPADYPTIPHEGGYATHRMAWGEANGKYYVYPTVLLQQDGTLKDYGDAAWDHTQKSGNYIEFNNARDAEWFSKSYKGAWGGRPNNEPQ